MTAKHVIARSVNYVSDHALAIAAIGFLVMTLANPLTYIGIALLSVDIQNAFGASIDRQSLGMRVDSSNPIFGAMRYVLVCGVVVFFAGTIMHVLRMVKGRK